MDQHSVSSVLQDDIDEEPEDQRPAADQLLEYVEPEVAAQNFLTTRDDEIKQKDMPERMCMMQIREKRTKFAQLRVGLQLHIVMCV